MVIRSIKAILYKTGMQTVLSRRRLRLIDRLTQNRLLATHSQCLRVLDVGCATGKDFVTFFQGREDVEMTGLNLRDYGLRHHNFRMVVGDAEQISFPDDYFDLVVCIGVLEHIEPIDKLAKVIEEIDRVSKSYVVVVPAVSTLVEPHTAQFLWPIRDHNRKSKYPGSLNYMSDETWLAFKGFENANVIRFHHIPIFVVNLVIYKTGNKA